MNCLQDTYMTQHVSEPTRGRNGEDPSILDLVISNDPNITSEISYEAPLGKSDHACLKFNINCFRTEQGKNRKFHLYDKGDYVHMASELNNVDWQQKIGHLGDPDEAYEVFCKVLRALIDKYVPALITNKSHKAVKRFSNDTLRAIKKKHRAWRRYVETRSGQKYQEYVRQRNKVTKLTRQAQKEYEKTVAMQMKDNPNSGNLSNPKQNLHQIFLICIRKMTTPAKV